MTSWTHPHLWAFMSSPSQHKWLDDTAQAFARRFVPLEANECSALMMERTLERADYFEGKGAAFIRDQLRKVLTNELEAWCWDERAKRIPATGWLKDYELAERLGWKFPSGVPIRATYTLAMLQRPGDDQLELLEAECWEFGQCSALRRCDCWSDELGLPTCSECLSSTCDHGVAEQEASLVKALKLGPAELAAARGEYSGGPKYAVKLYTRALTKVRTANGFPPRGKNDRQRPEQPGDEFPIEAVETIKTWKPDDQELFRLAWVLYLPWPEIAGQLEGQPAALQDKAHRLKGKAMRSRSSFARVKSLDYLTERESVGGSALTTLLDRSDPNYDHNMPSPQALARRPRAG